MIEVSSRPAEPAHHLVLNEEDLAYEEEIIREVPSHHLFTDRFPVTLTFIFHLLKNYPYFFSPSSL
jgi:hypothetical protein